MVKAKAAAHGLIVLAISVSTTWGAAPPDGGETWAERVDALERKIEVLESRVRALEAQAGQATPAAVASPAQVSPGQWNDARNWRNLEGRMTESEVQEVLGRPDKTKSVGKFEYWYYGEYKVVFYLGRVDSWLAP